MFVITLSGCKIYYHVAPISLWINGLKSEDENVRMEVAEVLSTKKTRKFLPELISSLVDKNRIVRGFCVISIGNLGESAEPAVPALIQLLENETDHINRCSICVTLSEIKEKAKDAIPILIKILEIEDEKLKLFSALAFSLISESVTHIEHRLI